MRDRGVRLGVALGGGAALGLSHLGVLRAFEQAEIQMDLLTGTSMGALIGAMFATTPSTADVERRIIEYFSSEQFRQAKFSFLKERRAEKQKSGFLANLTNYLKKSIFYGSSMTRQSFIPEEEFRKNIYSLIEPTSIERTLIPFYPVAADLTTGEEIILKSGSLQEAVCASCAIPGIFPPIKVGERLLVDGSWIDTVPVKPARDMGADLVVGVDVDKGIVNNSEFKSGLDVSVRAGEITRHKLKNLGMKDADFIIKLDPGDIFWGDFGKVKMLIENGEKQAAPFMEEIKKLMKKRSIKKFFLGPFQRTIIFLI